MPNEIVAFFFKFKLSPILAAVPGIAIASHFFAHVSSPQVQPTTVHHFKQTRIFSSSHGKTILPSIFKTSAVLIDTLFVQSRINIVFTTYQVFLPLLLLSSLSVMMNFEELIKTAICEFSKKNSRISQSSYAQEFQ